MIITIQKLLRIMTHQSRMYQHSFVHIGFPIPVNYSSSLRQLLHFLQGFWCYLLLTGYIAAQDNNHQVRPIQDPILKQQLAQQVYHHNIP